MTTVFNVLNYIVLFILLTAVVIFGYQRRKSKKSQPKSINLPKEDKKNIDYGCEYVQDFLNFERIDKDMIIREKGSKFTMVIHCSGINFDLMSESEKTMVEEAFIELLNFIQFPIQIYVQTRKVDLKDSLKSYSSKITTIENELRALVDEHSSLKADNTTSSEQLEMLEYEIKRKQNLYEYAADLKTHIERMSINSNVLQHRYYIVVTYRIEELGLMVDFTDEEIAEMAYSELYTRCHSIISALVGCDIEAKILDSNGLAELLYMAFNRDDAELYRLNDSMEAGFYRLFSTTDAAVGAQPNIAGAASDENEMQVQLAYGLGFDEISKKLLMESAGETR